MNAAVPVGEDKAGAVMSYEVKCMLQDLQFKIFFINNLWRDFTHESPIGHIEGKDKDVYMLGG